MSAVTSRLPCSVSSHNRFTPSMTASAGGPSRRPRPRPRHRPSLPLAAEQRGHVPGRPCRRTGSRGPPPTRATPSPCRRPPVHRRDDHASSTEAPSDVQVATKGGSYRDALRPRDGARRTAQPSTTAAIDPVVVRRRPRCPPNWYHRAPRTRSRPPRPRRRRPWRAGSSRSLRTVALLHAGSLASRTSTPVQAAPAASSGISSVTRGTSARPMTTPERAPPTLRSTAVSRSTPCASSSGSRRPSAQGHEPAGPSGLADPLHDHLALREERRANRTPRKRVAGHSR